MSLKQTVNRVTIEGYLNNKEWEIKEKDGRTFITGEVGVKAGKTNIVPVEVFSYADKKDGGENAVFRGLQTVFNETTALSETDDTNEATKVRITAGQIRINEFVGRDGSLASAAKYNTNFINRVNDDSFTPKAKFEVEMIVQKFRPEIKDDEETGDGFVDGYIVDYSGNLKPLTLKASKKVYEKLEDKVDKNTVMLFAGDILNSVVTKKIVTEMDFGEDEERIVTNSKRERLITGAKYSDYEFEKDDLKEALKQRQKYLKTLEDKKNGTFEGGKAKDINPVVEDDDDDLPF